MAVYPTLIELIERTSRFHKQVALKVPRVGKPGYEEATFAELIAWSQTLAAALQRSGIQPGDKIALIAKPRLEWAIGLHAVLRAGGVAVPIDAALTPPEAVRLLRAAQVRWVMASGEWVEQLAALADLKETAPSVERLVSFDHLELDGVLTYGELMAQPGQPQPVTRKPSDLALLMCTSGTTGDAKAVMLSHENLSSNVVNTLQVITIGASDVVVEIAPWNHIFGVLVLMVNVTTGCKVIYTDDYRRLPELMAQEGVTIMVGVPKLFHGIYEKLEQTLMANPLKKLLLRHLPWLIGRKVLERFGGKLRFMVSGSAPLNPKVMQGLRQLGIGIIEGYGMTESSPVLTASTAFNAKYGSVGPAIPSLELKIADPDEEQVGEVVVRGPNIMQGYYNNEARTREAIDEGGWLHTGDLGYLDEENWLFLKGRKKNVIVLESGKNVYPEELEFQFAKIPEIAEVMVTSGQRKGTEVIKVLIYPDYEVVPAETPVEQLKALIWEKVRHESLQLAHFKRPKSEHDLIVVDTPFQKTSTLDIKRYLYSEAS